VVVIKTAAKAAITVAKSLGLDLRPLSNEGRLAGVQVLWKKQIQGLRGSIVEFTFDDKPVRFFVQNEFDLIQRVHLSKAFYEPEELALIQDHFGGGCFVDVGANVGNHTVFALTFLSPTKIIAFEPNPSAYNLLQINVVLNRHDIPAELHNVGLADIETCASIDAPTFNLGRGRLKVDGKQGQIKIVRGDSLLLNEPHIGFVKIDAEGFEVEVMKGMVETLRKHKPMLFVEVDASNTTAFEAFCSEHQYSEVKRFQRYETSTNFLVRPVDG
jgi:FkbM family methyltransferase